MKALVFDKSIQLVDLPKPEAGGEALIRVTLAGICNTDVEIVKGYMGFSGVMGHEFVGVVEEAPTEGLIGKRVVGEINAGCGVCPLCVQGDPRHCTNRTVLGIQNRPGAFAEYLTLPTENLHVVPEVVSDRAAVFTEPIAAARQIIEQVDVKGKRTLLVGDGKLAQLIARVLPAFDAELTVVGKHDAKLALLPDNVEKMRLDQYTANKNFDIAVEASGSPSGFNLALASLRAGGTMVLKSTYAQEMRFNPAPLVIDEIRLIGSRCGRFTQTLELLRDGRIDPTPLISATYPIDDAVVAFEKAVNPESMKVLLEF